MEFRRQIRVGLIVSIMAMAGSLALFSGCESNVQKYREQGVKLYEEKHLDQSLATLTKALSYDEFDAVSNAYAGLIYYQSGDYVQAAYHFKVALQSDPSSNQAKDGLTAAYIRLGKPDLALDYLERASAMADKVKDPRWEKSEKMPYKKQTEEGLYLGKAGDRLRIGRAYEQLGDYDNALVYYKKALALQSDSAEVLFALALLYEKTGNAAETREFLIRTYNVDPSMPELTDTMTRNHVAISSVIGAPAAPATANTQPAK